MREHKNVCPGKRVKFDGTNSMDCSSEGEKNKFNQDYFNREIERSIKALRS